MSRRVTVVLPVRAPLLLEDSGSAMCGSQRISLGRGAQCEAGQQRRHARFAEERDVDVSANQQPGMEKLVWSGWITAALWQRLPTSGLPAATQDRRCSVFDCPGG